MQLSSLIIRIVFTIISVLILVGVLWILTRSATPSAAASTSEKAVYPSYYFRLDSERPNLNQSLSGLPKGFKDAFAAFGYSEGTSFTQSKWIILRSLDRVDQTIGMLPIGPQQAIHGLKGSDWLACKARMYKIMERYFEQTRMRHLLDAFLARTYVLDRPEDLQALTERHQRLLGMPRQPTPVYILKQNVQRQQGHLLTQDLNKIHAIAKDSNMSPQGEPPYMVVQEMLQDPFIIRGRKINLRVYLLILIRGPDPGQAPEFYLCNNGFLYYTPKPFVPYSTDKDEVITTGYIDRQVYEENPLSHRDLEAYLGPRDYAKLTQHMLTLFGHVKGAFQSLLQDENRNIPGTKYLVYGCDVAPSRQLETVRLMEINKGPDLSYKDERDKQVKFTMLQDMIHLVNGTPSVTSTFVRL